jgi:Phosphate-induced protein 1 conserved region
MKVSKRISEVLILAAVSAGAALAQPPVEIGGPPQIIIHKTNPHQGQNAQPTAGSTGQITPFITWHGGPVMNTPTVYLIWYGNWNQNNGSDTPQGQTIVTDFLFGLSGSPYYLTNTTYNGSGNSVVTGKFTLGGSYTDSYSQGSNLQDRRVASVVSNAISHGLGKSPANPNGDPNGIYFVLTSSDVAETSGFCSRYCGWHTYGTLGSTNIKYSFVGNANRCLNACSMQTTGPNGNAGVDAMVSVIAHELEETNTDPNLNAWYDANGAEDADKCAWTFGKNQSQDPVTGAWSNMTLATPPGSTLTSRSFLIQRELASNSMCYVNWTTQAQ